MNSAEPPEPAERRDGPPRTMPAAVIRKYGDPRQLHVEELPVPRPRRDQVLIRVHAAGINPIDYRIRQGQLRWILPARFPLVLGYDVSGVIVACGDDVPANRLSAGQQVVSFLNNRHGGGYAGYVCAGADAVAQKPDNLTHAEAAAIPLAASTALQALRYHARIRPGNNVLVNGASGGVGHFAVQLAKLFSAKVTAVCSERNLDFVRELGADEVIDYGKDDFTRLDRQFDMVFDAVAKSSCFRCRPILRPGGRYITTVPSVSGVLAYATPWKGVSCRIILARPRRADLEFLSRAAADGNLVPHIDEIFPLTEAAGAHAKSEQHHARGKLVLAVRHDAAIQ